MDLQIIHVGLLGTNCYVTWDDEKNCSVVDCGGEAAKVASFISENSLTPTHLLLTHGHGDHMGGVAGLKAIYPNIKIVMSKKDEELVTDESKSMARAVSPEWQPFEADMFVKEGDEVVSGKMVFSVLDTPGHTKGGLSFLKGKQLYSGDTLFQGSMGRTDLYGGNDTEMVQSLKKLGNLGADIIVLPGHGSATNMEDELRTNPYLRQAMKA